MKVNRKNIRKEDFRRYLEDQMTDAERNTFERQLQKNQFESEAVEGFARISNADFEKDLAELSRQITRKKSSGNIRFRLAAAVILLLGSTGILWYLYSDSALTPQVSEMKNMVENETLPVQNQSNEPLKSKTEKAEGLSPKQPEKQDAGASDISKVIVTSKSEENTDKAYRVSHNMESILNDSKLKVKDSLAEVKLPESENSVVRASETPKKLAISEVFSDQKGRISEVNSSITVRGKVVSSEDKQAIPGVTIVEKGTSNGTITDIDGNFTMQLRNASDSVLIASFVGMEQKEFRVKVDADLLVGLEPSKLAMEEVVMVGYGVATKGTPEANGIQEASPKIGTTAFRKYLNEKAILPNDYLENKVIVRVRVKVDNKGRIVSVKNIDWAEAAILDKARQLIQDGPEWNPRMENGITVESEVILRLVFRKRK